eukprot:gnl/Dysnectes_brevis/6794_a10804_507.p1 GENE.gnl/Dysnectes_brevis/6794_a10804_507~~gnl/Dysnectes_brevis/6794_a10804_507.p1  ORF type:complete len:137 (-),score=1.48 gnl/Dysnectes_brevis/6794_a10804_507:99-470(-)
MAVVIPQLHTTVLKTRGGTVVFKVEALVYATNSLVIFLQGSSPSIGEITIGMPSMSKHIPQSTTTLSPESQNAPSRLKLVSMLSSLLNRQIILFDGLPSGWGPQDRDDAQYEILKYFKGFRTE